MRAKIRWGGRSKVGRRQLMADGGFMGSVVGIQLEVVLMYTGTLIEDLMAAVDLAHQKAEERRVAEQDELHEIFSMQIPVNDEQIFQGAA